MGQNDVPAAPEDERAEASPDAEAETKGAGENFEKKLNDVIAKLPPSVNALGDVLCVGGGIVIVAWICQKLGWVGDVLSWPRVAVLAVLVFAVSLIVRLARKDGCGTTESDD